jgi:hypothetical protein
LTILLQLGDSEKGPSAKSPPKTAILRTFHQGITLQPHLLRT